MNYKNYFNRNKVIDNSYTCLHFTDKMKIEINPNNNSDDGKVTNMNNCNSFCNYYYKLSYDITIKLSATHKFVHKKLTGAQKISETRI